MLRTLVEPGFDLSKADGLLDEVVVIGKVDSRR